MNILLKYIFIFIPMVTSAHSFKFKLQKEKFDNIPFGEIKPEGWIKNQMQNDLNGFVGQLDSIVPDLMNDPIYYERLHKNSKLKDLGNLKAGDAEGEEQYKWWNSETQSNWHDAYIRNVLLLENPSGRIKVKEYVDKILSSQDEEDGYLGIYDRNLRFSFKTENGELWSKTTLYRGLLAYYEFTHDEKVWKALVKAVDNVMANYSVNASNPFYAGKQFSGGVAHGLTFTDICDKMYKITNEDKYRQYALFLYTNFSDNFSSEKDVRLVNILDTTYRLQSHGVHTFEHLRPLIVAAFSSNDTDLQKALKIYLKRIEKVTTLSGGPIGDEWIGSRMADETTTGYEYCSIQELTDSYCVLLQKEGLNSIADNIENTFYNAAQGSRNPVHSGIAYLKTDNSYEMEGTKNGMVEPDKKQTRYKYSPAHQEVAVCCSPNAGRITPYFIQNTWMKEGKNTLVATLLGPCQLETTLNNNPILIHEITGYPYENELCFQIVVEKPVRFRLKIRKPGWVRTFTCNKPYTLENGYIVIEKIFSRNEKILLNFEAEIEIHQDKNSDTYFTCGALLYAYPIPYTESKGRIYSPTLSDYYYKAKTEKELRLIENQKPQKGNGKILIQMLNKTTNLKENIELIPFGKTILRQVTFKY
jgi:DUF1680 family protein